MKPIQKMVPCVPIVSLDNLNITLNPLHIINVDINHRAALPDIDITSDLLEIFDWLDEQIYSFVWPISAKGLFY